MLLNKHSYGLVGDDHRHSGEVTGILTGCITSKGMDDEEWAEESLWDRITANARPSEREEVTG